jgi:hypothetical protein
MTLEQLEHLHALRSKPDDLPHTVTRGEADAYARDTATLDHRIVAAKAAMTTLAELSDDADVAWLDHLNAWRKALCDELLTIKSPIRDPKVMGRSQNLTVSIRCIDFGAGQFRDSQWALETSRLGELMVASGYAVTGADASRAYVGTLPWRGSIKEVEERLRETAKRREQAQQQLDSALMDDDVRAAQEAEAKKFRDALDTLRLRGPNLDVQGVDEADLTPLQKEALARARRATLGETVAS